MNIKRKPRRARAHAEIHSQPHIAKLRFVYESQGESWNSELVVCLYLPATDETGSDRVADAVEAVIDQISRRGEQEDGLNKAEEIYIDWLVAVPNQDGPLWQESELGASGVKILAQLGEGFEIDSEPLLTFEPSVQAPCPEVAVDEQEERGR